MIFACKRKLMLDRISIVLEVLITLSKYWHWRAGATRFTCLSAEQLAACVLQDTQYVLPTDRNLQIVWKFLFGKESISNLDLSKIESIVDFFRLLKEHAPDVSMNGQTEWYLASAFPLAISFLLVVIYGLIIKISFNWSVKINLNSSMFPVPNYSFSRFQNCAWFPSTTISIPAHNRRGWEHASLIHYPLIPLSSPVLSSLQFHQIPPTSGL